MKHTSLLNPLFLIYTLFVSALLLAGCLTPNTQTTPQIENMLPEGWSPLSYRNRFLPWLTSVWTPINVDGTSREEYLLFFAYDNGQIGATIYEQIPIGSSGILSPTPIPAPNQPANSFIPYRLAPSYWQGSGAAGYVAEPETQYEQITILQLQRNPASELETGVPVTDTQPAAIKELVILGGDTLMTVAWWQNAYYGYGVTQVRARAGLVNRRHQDNDNAKPVVSITGLDPLPDPLGRSVMCRQTLYTRSPAPKISRTDENLYASAIRYHPSDEGIVFCKAPLPAYPFYPEGVTLAFLRPEDRSDPQTIDELNRYRLTFVQNESDIADIKKAEEAKTKKMKDWLLLFDFDGPDNETMPTVIVDQLVMTPTLTLTEDYRKAGTAPLTTVVCAVVRSPDRQFKRYLLFHMQHQPPSFVAVPNTNDNQAASQTSVTDRMIITDVVDMTTKVANTVASGEDVTTDVINMTGGSMEKMETAEMIVMFTDNRICRQLVANATAAAGQPGTQP